MATTVVILGLYSTDIVTLELSYPPYKVLGYCRAVAHCCLSF